MNAATGWFIGAGVVLLGAIILSIVIWFTSSPWVRGSDIGVTWLLSFFLMLFCIGIGFSKISSQNKADTYNEKYDIHLTQLSREYVRYNDGKCYAARVDDSNTLLAIGCIDAREVGE